MSRRIKPWHQRWGWPLALAVLTIGGLLFALVGDSAVWRVLSWIALSVPLLIILKCWPLRRLLNRRPIQ